ncbi:hypothetical protein [Litoreibacter roseus]|uniref:Uncharacterized protein n=1 Tax=Litoreibacter roseus TaxID=2601869 RepID=A0A6N6JLI4_9RHOB|nr:hypothetical protein [Litoreibacter roseus]GFE66042.1 hypothetical protein KIN_31160 [Litoreibacter roseus]
MKIVLHLGVHATDEDKLLSCLLQNRDGLLQKGVIVPPPLLYRQMLRETVQLMKEEDADHDILDATLEVLLEDQTGRRIVLSHAGFLGPPGRAVEAQMFYPYAAERVSDLRALFPDHELELFIGLRDPATFLPTLFEKSPESDFDEFSDGCDPENLTWSDMIIRLKEALPDVPITLWCNEDTPIIWPEILNALCGLPTETELDGTTDFLASLMSPQGFARMKGYIASKPITSVSQRRRVTAAFLEKFALDEALMQEIDLPNWSDEFIDGLSTAYDADVAKISQMDGVTLLHQ